jgi:hypothetical protein
MTDDPDPPEDFLALSAMLTGYGRADLLGTGVARRYYDEVVSVVGDAVCRELLEAAAACAAEDDPARRERAVRRTVLAHPKLGPVARNVIKMWYLGSWRQLPRAWRAAYGDSPAGGNHVVSAQAYQEGLVWRAIGSHPPGAKPPGFGTWALEPRAETD